MSPKCPRATAGLGDGRADILRCGASARSPSSCAITTGGGVARRPRCGAIYPYDDALFRGRALHYFDRHLLTASQQRRYERLVSLIIADGTFAGLPLGVVADPQAIATASGLAFVDFEPSHHYTELFAYLQQAIAAQRHEVLCAFWDVNPTFTGSFPAAVGKQIREALATELFRGIARERLGVQRNRHVRSAFAAGHPIESMRRVVAALQSEAGRIRRNAPAVRLKLRSTRPAIRDSVQIAARHALTGTVARFQYFAGGGPSKSALTSVFLDM